MSITIKKNSILVQLLELDKKLKDGKASKEEIQEYISKFILIKSHALLAYDAYPTILASLTQPEDIKENHYN